MTFKVGSSSAHSEAIASQSGELDSRGRWNVVVNPLTRSLCCMILSSFVSNTLWCSSNACQSAGSRPVGVGGTTRNAEGIVWNFRITGKIYNHTCQNKLHVLCKYILGAGQVAVLSHNPPPVLIIRELPY
jgi:hypothetical protein